MISVFFLSYMVHKLGSAYYISRVKQNKTTPKVFDIGHKYIPDLSENKILEILSHILAYSPLFYFYFYHRELLDTYVGLNITILFIRSIFIFVTILPKHKTCDDSIYTLKNLLIGHCYDKIFSGHFSSTLLGLLILQSNNIISLSVSCVLGALQALLIIATRSHYTIDILVAFYVTWTVFKLNLHF